MAPKCSVPNCRGNYKNEEYVSIFSFPRNEPLRSLWLKSIGREDFNPTIHSKVCERHFLPSDILRESKVFDEKLGNFISNKLTVPKLKKGAIPSIITLGSCPPPSRNERVRRIKTLKAREEAEESADFEEPTVNYEVDFNDLSELEAFMHFFDVGEFWSVIKGSKNVAFVHVNWNHAPRIDLSVVIDENLSVTLFHANVKVKLLKNFKFPKTVKSVAEMNIILNEVKAKATFESEKASDIELVKDILNSLAKKSVKSRDTFLFLKEQVSVLTEKYGRTFSIDMLVFSSLLYAMAPHVYKYLTHSKYLVLPDPETICKLCMPLEECTPNEPNTRFLQYAREGFELTTESDRCVVLQVEEIYLKPFFEGKQVKTAGMSYNSMATSAYVFMITSLCSPFKDIVHITPMQTLNARDLNLTLKQIILSLEEVGYSVIAVVTDNSYLNKKIMSFFSEPPVFNSIVYKHPVHSSRPLFHLIGFAHLLKSVRNDWMNKKTCDECILYPPFDENCDSQIYKKASFNALRKVHATESFIHEKYLSQLTVRALSPNYVDKQDPKLVLKIFSPRVTEVLMQFGEEKELPHYQETADFIKIFHAWWSVVNPRSLLKATHFNSGHELPLSISDENYDFLKKFLDWLDGWSNMKLDCGMLRAETYSVLRLSTHALIELTAYCKNELGVNFIFPGNFLTECQISRFGCFKSHPGIQKFFSLRELNKEKQVLRSTVNCGLSLIEKNDVNLCGLHLMDSIKLVDEKLSLNTYVPLTITDEDFTSIQVDVSALIYLGACSIRSVLKNLQCKECEKHLLTEREVSLHYSYHLMVNLTEEKIRYPPRNIINTVHCIFIVLKKLCNERKRELIRAKLPNKTLAYNLTMNVIESLDLSLDFQECGAGHSSEKVLKMIVKAVVYSILNNYLKNSFNILAPPVKKTKIDILLNNPRYDIRHLLNDGI